MPILCGTSRADDPETAVTDLKAMIDQSQPACRLVFCSANRDLGAVGRALARQFPDGPTIGCSTAGEIGPNGYVSNSLTGISLPAADFAAVAGLIGDIAEFDLDRTRREIAELLVTLGAKAGAPLAGHTFALLLIDGMCGQEEWLVSAIADILGEIPLLGGSAGDNLRFQSTSVFCEGAFHTDAAVLLLVYTPCPFTLFATQHFAGTPQKLVVTAADPSARIVTEINGEPAAEEYARLVGLEPDLLNPMIFAAHPVVVRVGGRYYVRSIRKLNPDGSLSFFCAIDEGLVLTVAEGLDIVGSLADALAQVRDEVGPPQLIIGCDCILRRLEIDRRGLTETISAILSANRVIGFNTYGEHIHAIHVNQTLTGIAIGAAPTPLEITR